MGRKNLHAEYGDWGSDPEVLTSRSLSYSSVSLRQYQPSTLRCSGEAQSGRSALGGGHAADHPVLSLQVTAMSVRVRFLAPGDSGAVGAVGRSASFAGFSSTQSRRIA